VKPSTDATTDNKRVDACRIAFMVLAGLLFASGVNR
jgi:hypothetical protein